MNDWLKPSLKLKRLYIYKTGWDQCLPSSQTRPAQPQRPGLEGIGWLREPLVDPCSSCVGVVQWRSGGARCCWSQRGTRSYSRQSQSIEGVEGVCLIFFRPSSPQCKLHEHERLTQAKWTITLRTCVLRGQIIVRRLPAQRRRHAACSSPTDWPVLMGQVGSVVCFVALYRLTMLSVLQSRYDWPCGPYITVVWFFFKQ